MSATEKWTARRGPTQELDDAGKTRWTANITYQVTGAADEREAVAQCPLVMGADHPVYGNELRVNIVDPNRAGAAGFYEVDFGFSSRAPGTGGTVNQNARINWIHDIVVEQVDHDVIGHVLSNSAGDVSVMPQENEFIEWVLAYTQWEPGFNLRKGVRFLGAINNDNVAISFGSGPFNGSGGIFGTTAPPLGVYKGEMKCTALRPVGDYEPTQSLVQVYYEFRIRERIQINSEEWWSRWDWRFLDQGTRGRYYSSTSASAGGASSTNLGDFWTAAGNPVTEPVRLNGYGVPLDTSITVEGNTPAANPTPPKGAELDLRYAKDDPGAVFLLYPRCKRDTFKGLLPIFK